jgi:imidazolonepropionase-like amidohydrolase
MSLRLNLVVFWFVLSAVQGATGSPCKIAITHVTVVDVRAGTIEKDMTVLIVGDRISAVRAAKETKRLPTEEITVIDGRGKYLIPGLWDMHAHSGGDDRALHLFIAYGITGIRDMAGDATKLSDARRRITSGELTGPRLVFSGPMLEGPPSQADDWTWIIHSPEEARNAVNRLVELRVDFIKVHDGLARESYSAIAAASKERGISFVGHVPASMTPAEASDLGQKSIEHLEFVPKPCHALFESVVGGAPRKLLSGCDPQSLKELLDRFARNGTWLDPTIQSFRYWAPTQWNAIFLGFRELVPSIRQNHVSILAGTDSSGVLEEKGDPPGSSLHDELALLVDAGFTPSEALRAATLNPALFLGLSDSLGAIEPGKTASMVLLDANPLQGIRNTRRIAAVISEGRYLSREVLERLRRENCRNCSVGSAH